VPIVFAGATLTAQRVERKVWTIDVAATLSAYMGVNPPSGAAGTPPVEVLAR